MKSATSAVIAAPARPFSEYAALLIAATTVILFLAAWFSA